MSGTVNKAILIGNLGKDPEIRVLETGVKIARFSIATTEVYMDKTTGERRKTTDWHNIVLWRGLADIADKYLTKGQKVFIEGRIKTRSWKDETGSVKYTTEINGDNLTILSQKAESESLIKNPQFKTEDALKKPLPLDQDLLNDNEDDVLPF